MIRTTIAEIQERVELLPEQVRGLELFEELQTIEARYQRRLKKNPVIGYDKDGIEIYQNDQDYLFEFIDSLVKGKFAIINDKIVYIPALDKKERFTKVLELKKQNISNREISRMLGTSEGAIRKMLKKV
jgi:hypothetical protein